MPIIRFEMTFASMLLTVLCVIPFEPTWIVTMPGRSSFKIAIMKWSNLLIMVPLKLFKCVLSSLIELLNFVTGGFYINLFTIEEL